VLYETIRGVQRVAACSREAASWRVRPGMSIAEAKAACGFAEADDKLTIANGKLRIEPYDPGADRAAMEELAERCERFSPTVGVESGDRPEGVLLDISEVTRLFGGEQMMAETIGRDFAQRGFTVRLGLADTIGAAWAAARHGEEGSRKREVGGQRAEDTGNVSANNFLLPSSCFPLSCAIFNLQSHTLPAALAPFPIEALRLSTDVLDTLHQLGIGRVAQLDALPREELSSRFTPELLRRMDQAAGRLAEVIPSHRAVPQFRAEWAPEHPIAQREAVEAAVKQLVGELCESLARRGQGALQVECRLLCPPYPAVQVDVGLFEPSSDAAHVFGLIELRLERLRLPGPMAAVLLSAPATAALVYQQQELFSGGHQQERQLVGLVDRLSSRLGRRAVLGVRLLSDAQPELAWRGEPLVDRPLRRTNRKKRDLSPRPLVLRRRPTALAAVSIGPDGFGREGRPAGFQLAGRQYRVARCWGPERIETGWWRGRAVGRDYYRVETTKGSHYWVFRRLRDGKWFFQGVFG